MILFLFEVKKAFLKYTSHPITIPRENYIQLIEDIYEGSGERTIPVSIIPPNGRILDGSIYYGISGYGPYYQIKVKGEYPSDYFGNLRIGETIGVNIQRSRKKINVKLISPENLREAGNKLLEPTNKCILRKNTSS